MHVADAWLPPVSSEGFDVYDMPAIGTHGPDARSHETGDGNDVVFCYRDDPSLRPVHDYMESALQRNAKDLLPMPGFRKVMIIRTHTHHDTNNPMREDVEKSIRNARCVVAMVGTDVPFAIEKEVFVPSSENGLAQRRRGPHGKMHPHIVERLLQLVKGTSRNAVTRFLRTYLKRIARPIGASQVTFEVGYAVGAGRCVMAVVPEELSVGRYMPCAIPVTVELVEADEPSKYKLSEDSRGAVLGGIRKILAIPSIGNRTLRRKSTHGSRDERTRISAA